MANTRPKTKMSPLRKEQFIIFIFRLVIYASTIALFILYILDMFNVIEADFVVKQFEILKGWNFFKQFSVFHILWVIWMFCMFCQLFPLPGKLRTTFKISLGSQKLFKTHYNEAPNRPDRKALMVEYKKASRKALVLLAVWVSAILALSLIRVILGQLGVDGHFLNICLFMVSATFYACDLICGLFWCPFRTFFMKHRCCLNCRIFNWDHMMMFTPMTLVPSFFSWSLLATGLLVMGLWELKLIIHPERFFESSNQNLKCANCTDFRCRKFGGAHAYPHKNKQQ